LIPIKRTVPKFKKKKVRTDNISKEDSPVFCIKKIKYKKDKRKQRGNFCAGRQTNGRQIKKMRRFRPTVSMCSYLLLLFGAALTPRRQGWLYRVSASLVWNKTCVATPVHALKLVARRKNR